MIPDRKNVFLGKTPQGFRFQLLWEAHKKVTEKNQNKIDSVVTNDAFLVQYFDLAKINTIEGNYSNKKITYSEDFNLFDIQIIKDEQDAR